MKPRGKGVAIPEALLATAVPEPMATPISAFLRAGASLTPSPVWRGRKGEMNLNTQSDTFPYHCRNSSIILKITHNFTFMRWFHTRE